MANCTRCGQPVSVLNRDLATGLCADCRRDDAGKASAARRKQEEQYQRQLEVERVRRTTTPPEEPTNEPLDGLVLIAISVVAAVLGGIMVASTGAAVFGYIIIGIAGMLYLAGVIRWAVSGSQLLQLNRLQRQNVEIIKLLKMIAHKDRN